MKDKNGKSLNRDDALPEEIKEPWIKWIKDIKEISKFTTNRYLFKNMEEIPTRDKLYLHCFTDAGQNGWGISIYIRFYNMLITKYESHLIYATSRVAPTKTTLTTPKKGTRQHIVGMSENRLHSRSTSHSTNQHVYPH